LPINSTFPNTSIPAHVHSNYSRWALPDSILEELWILVQNAPISPQTSRRYLGLTVINNGMIGFASNMICSAQIADIPSNAHFFIALDIPSYQSILKIGAQALLFQTGNFTSDAVNNQRLIEFYDIVKVKPTFIHQLLLWNVEAIPIDADMIFFSNALNLFIDSADFETQCDSKEFFRIPYHNDSVAWQVNLGFYKIHPTPVVMKLMPIWLARMYNAPKIQDQSALRRILRGYPTRWLNNDTAIVDVRQLFKDSVDTENITLRFLDPMLITNAGGLWQEGKEDWQAEAKLRKIKRPIANHFFHMGFIRSKLELMIEEQLWFVEKSGVCVKSQPKGVIKWPLWNS
jgi:hypothetical protein